MKMLAIAVLSASLVLPGAAIAKGPKHCPPGLAKKTPACVPPGQANKAYSRDDDWNQNVWRDYRDIRVGDRVIINGDEYRVVKTGERVVLRRDDDYYRLPWPGRDRDYVRIGNVIVQVDRKTKAVFEIIELADLILN